MNVSGRLQLAVFVRLRVYLDECGSDIRCGANKGTMLNLWLNKYGRTALTTLGLMVVAVPSFADSKPDVAEMTVEPITIESRRIDHFFKSDPARLSFDRLEFRGGLILTSPSRSFGGWSGLEISADGRSLLAISDAGVWMTADLVHDGNKPVGMRNARIGPILGTSGTPLIKERDRDAEGLVLIDGTLSKGNVLIAFEQNHRIGRFPLTEKGLGAPTAYLTLAPEMRRQPSNKSLESVCALRGGPNKGAIIALSERYPTRGGQLHRGWMQNVGAPSGQAAWSQLDIRNIGGFDLTDCRGLPDGSLLVLERRFRWSSWYEGVKARLRRFQPSEVRVGAIMEGEILLEADMDYEIDNLEGLSVHRSAQGDTVLTMISDNNFSTFIQRTVLLQFTLKNEAGAQTAQQPLRR